MSDLIDLIFDPGHGGADPGAVGLTTSEKSNVLVLASNEVYAVAPGGEGEKLAKAICTRMAAQLGMIDRGVKFAGWYVCKWTDMLAVLVEYGFINSEEATILAKMDQAALTIAQGIGDHFGVDINAQRKEEGIVDNAILMYSDEDYWAAKDVSAKNGGIAMFVRQGTARTVPADALKTKHLFTGHKGCQYK